MTKKESIFILFSITLCWSSSYIFIKDIPQSFSVYAYLALTSGVAGIILALVMRRKFRLLNSVSLRQGLILGALITLSNMFEKLFHVFVTNINRFPYHMYIVVYYL